MSGSRSELVNRYYLLAGTDAIGPFHELVCMYILSFYLSLGRQMSFSLTVGRSTHIANQSSHIYTNVLIVCNLYIYLRLALRPSLFI